MRLSNNKGFALAMTLALLPALLGVSLLAFTVVGLLQFDLATKYACREVGLTTQDQVAGNLKTLMQLNTLSRTLKAQQILAKAAMIAGALNINPAVLQRAKAWHDRVERQRLTLDRQQKALINISNRLLDLGLLRGRTKISKAGSEGIAGFSFLSLSFSQPLTKPPRLSVKADSSDIAPTYSLLDDFEAKQTLAQKWLYQIEVRRPFQMFFDGKIEIKRACEATLKQEGNSWIAKIKKAKPSLR